MQFMNGAIDNIRSFYHSLRLILITPVVYALHALEELSGFPQWVSSNLSSEFTIGHFHRNIIVFLVATIFISIITYRFPRRIIVFLFITWVSGLFLSNALFHIGASIYVGEYSPGLISCILIYIPFTLLMVRLALKESLLSKQWIITALILGGIAHYLFLYGDLVGWTF